MSSGPTRDDLLAVAALAEALADTERAREAVREWNTALYDHHIIDPGYAVEDAREWVLKALEDPSLVAHADLTRVRAMATFISRAERFSDGWLDDAADTGLAAALARRCGVMARE